MFLGKKKERVSLIVTFREHVDLPQSALQHFRRPVLEGLGLELMMPVTDSQVVPEKSEGDKMETERQTQR